MRFFRLLLLLLLMAPAAPAADYSVFTHQSIIDSTWADCLLPLLRQRYPPKSGSRPRATLTARRLRLAVSQLLPAVARAGWLSNRAQIRKASPRARRRDYVYRGSQRRFRKEFDRRLVMAGPGGYMLADVTCGELLRTLQQHDFEQLTPTLQQNILAFFATGPLHQSHRKRKPKHEEEPQEAERS